MTTRNRFYLTLCFLLLTSAAVIAQAQTPAETRQRPLTVTVSVTAEHLRFAALTEVAQLRLEVLSAEGAKVFDSGFNFGNMLDWPPANQQGQALPDGAYSCLVTARDYSGRLIERRGKLLLQAGQASLATAEPGELQAPNPLAAIERPELLSPMAKEAGLATMLLAHDGKDGRLVSGSGALSFRSGNFFAGKDTERMRLTPEGNLGIGVSEPQARLDVAGLIRTATGIQFPDGTVQTTAASVNASALKAVNPQSPNAPASTVNALAKFVSPGAIDDSSIFDVGGNIGVGTSAPGGVFDLQRSSSSDLLQRFWNTGSAGAKLRYVSQTGANAQIQLTDFAEWLSAIAGNNTIGLQFRVRDSSSPNTEAQLDASARMTIARNGNVGIGTTSPQAKLDISGDLQVSGNAVISGNIAAKYQDVAEWVPAREALEAGTVVSLDLRNANEVRASRRAYDGHVAGVVSAQPGVLLGEAGEGKVLVATTGRVRVKVDASRGPIRIGDLLVTSPRTGLAMKSRAVRVGGVRLHRPGTIIGKALEPLAKGQGEILVLLSLQ